MDRKAEVLIIGGGFGGVTTASRLLKMGHSVTLINRTNYFIFTPLLHEVATGSLSSKDITFEYSSFFKHRNFSFFRETVSGINFEDKVAVTLDGERFTYDCLVVSTGARTNFFNLVGRDHVQEFKSIDDALDVKRKIVTLAQGAERRVVVNIVGAGPTGVELAFELKEFLGTIQKRSKDLSFLIRIIHAQDIVCSTFPKKIQEYALKTLTKEGIEVVLDTSIVEATENSVVGNTGETFEGDITIWSAGITPDTEIVGDTYKDERGNIIVDDTLNLKGREYEFAIGDSMAIEGSPTPKLAQAALKQAKFLARNINAQKHGGNMKSFSYTNTASLMSLGRGRGVVVSSFGVITGFFGWMIWKGAYLSKVPGFRNKLEVVFSWIVSLFSSRDIFEK